jgi:hypothetical protein
MPTFAGEKSIGSSVEFVLVSQGLFISIWVAKRRQVAGDALHNDRAGRRPIVVTQSGPLSVSHDAH